MPTLTRTCTNLSLALSAARAYYVVPSSAASESREAGGPASAAPPAAAGRSRRSPGPRPVPRARTRIASEHGGRRTPPRPRAGPWASMGDGTLSSAQRGASTARWAIRPWQGHTPAPWRCAFSRPGGQRVWHCLLLSALPAECVVLGTLLASFRKRLRWLH